MFSKTSKNTEIHSKTLNSNYTYSLGSRVDNLPKLISFSFKELSLPENYNGPLEGYLSSVINKSYRTQLYLPNYIFLINFEFDCTDRKSDALPKVTNRQEITEEEIDKKVETKQFLHRKKVEHQPVRRVITECILELGDLPLEKYLKTYGKGLKSVEEFLAIYEPAEKKFQRDMPQKLDENFTNSM